jgi:xylulokinase
MSLLVVDIGSSACKAVAFAVEGEILAQHASAYSADVSIPSHAEMNPCRFWEAVCTCTRSVTRRLSHPVRALCLSSHGETFVPINEGNEAVGRAILNQDCRAIHETAWLEQQLGRHQLFEITGLVAHPMYPIPKILWLRQQQPDVFSSAAKFVTVIGYILLKLGLPPYVDYSLASRYLAFDVRKRCWSEEILGAAELRDDRLPEPVPAGTIIGKLDASSASQLGVPSGIAVVLGGHDQPCGALGLGVTCPGQVADSMGTYECVLAASDEPMLSDAAFAASLNSYCHVVADKFVTIAYFPSGIMVKWLHDLLFEGTDQSESEQYALLEGHAPPGPSGLCITPNLIGTCNPDFNPNARGVVYGLTPGSGPAHLYKGILEGLACEFAQATRLLASVIGQFSDLHVTGGGTRSAIGLHLRAALAAKSLHVMRCPEAVCLGGAILAGVATGEYRSIDEGVSQLVREIAVVAPDAQIASAYVDQIKQYQWLRSLNAPAAN